MARGSGPTVVWFAKVIPLVLQFAVAQNVGWLNEIAKIKRRNLNKIVLNQMNNLIILEKENVHSSRND